MIITAQLSPIPSRVLLPEIGFHPPPPACKDQRDCSWIVEEASRGVQTLAEYCDMWKDTSAAVKQCPQTCGFCKYMYLLVDCRQPRSDPPVKTAVGVERVKKQASSSSSSSSSKY